MYYLEKGLGAKPGCRFIGSGLAARFSIFCFLASFGIGNMTRVNSISGNMESVFGVPIWLTGIVVLVLAGLVILGGLKRIASVTEKIVPFMVTLYIIGTVVILVTNFSQIIPVFSAIFRGAFAMKATGAAFVAIAIMLFAFSTVLGWSHYGSTACAYLFGEKSMIVYRVIFVAAIFGGAVIGDNLAWDIADTLNSLMMLPNLIGVLALSPVVYRCTQNYVDHKIKGKDIEPLLSNSQIIQDEQTNAVLHGAH